MKTHKKAAIAAILLTALCLAGCGDNNTLEENTQSVAEGGETTQNPQEDTMQGNSAQDENSLADAKLWTENQEGCIIQEDDKNIYVCGANQVMKMDKETGESAVLWENDTAKKKKWEYLYSKGSGLLLGDRIYFVEEWTDGNNNTQNSLSTVGTDGTGYERLYSLTDFADGASCNDALRIRDGVLFAYTSYYEDVAKRKTLAFRVSENGEILEQINEENREDSQLLAEGYRECSYKSNGDRILEFEESKERFGSYVAYTQTYQLVKIEPGQNGEDTERTELDENSQTSFISCNSRYLLMQGYNEDYTGIFLTLIDTKDWSRRGFYSGPSMSVLFMDEKYVYTTGEGEDERCAYYRISLDTGELTTLFTLPDGKLGEYSPHYMMNEVIRDNYLYYVGEDNYALYVMRRNLDNPDEIQMIGDCFYDAEIGKVGEIVDYHEKFYSNVEPDFLIAQTDLRYLKVSDRFAGAAKINGCIQEAMTALAQQEKAYAEMDADDEDIEGMPLNCSMYSSVHELSFYNRRYLSFCQNSNDYSGGAHGMPWQDGYTFDLETGKRLTLQDIVGNSEEEFKEIAVRYFRDLIETEPEMYWDDALSYVEEKVSLEWESEFYLTQEGISLSFGVYELAPYAAGYTEVCIPYEEFDMKIALGDA